MSPLSGHADTVSLWEAGSVEACRWTFSPVLNLAPPPDPGPRREDGRTGAHPHQLSRAKN